MGGEPDSYAVMWRPILLKGRRGRWEVQPFLWPGAAAAALANRLADQFGGETHIARVDLPSPARPVEGSESPTAILARAPCVDTSDLEAP